MTPAVLDSARRLFALLCQTDRLDPMDDIWTHQMVVGWKDCPRWYVHHPGEFDQFRREVADILATYHIKVEYYDAA